MKWIYRCPRQLQHVIMAALISTGLTTSCGEYLENQRDSSLAQRDFPHHLSVQYKDQEIKGDATGFCRKEKGGKWRCEDFWSEKYGARHFIAYSLGDTGYVKLDAPVELSEVEVEHTWQSNESTELEAPPWNFEAPQNVGYHEYVVCASWSTGNGCWIFGVKVVNTTLLEPEGTVESDGS